MRQRYMIAMAITCKPDLLIADEPTTALDVTVQAQVLDVLLAIKDEIDSAIMLITHDLGVVAGLADRVMVMYAGRQAEIGTAAELFYQTRHPYTLGLLASLPRLDGGDDEELVPIEEHAMSLIGVPPGCAFRRRCRFAVRLARPLRPRTPALRSVTADDCVTACHFAERLAEVSVESMRSAHQAGTSSGAAAPIDATPAEHSGCRTAGLLVAKDLVKDFPIGGVFSRAVGSVSAVAR
ncbi:MAG: hypothetical protein R2749_28715 [Acidimicrobiales bacterium]